MSSVVNVRQATIDKVLAIMEPGIDYRQRQLRTNRQTLTAMVRRRLIVRNLDALPTNSLQRPEDGALYRLNV